ESYLNLYQRYKADRQAEREEALARARAARQAQVAPDGQTQKTVASGNSNGSALKVAAHSENSTAPTRPAPARNGNGNGNGRSARSKNNGPMFSPHFMGDHFPKIEVSAKPDVKYEVIRDLESLEKAVELMRHERVLSVDTETNGLDPHTSKLLLVQVSTPELCYIIDSQQVPLHPLQAVLENDNILKLLQNAKFDYEMLKQQGGIELKNIYDTMLAERLLTAGLGNQVNLAELTKKYLGQVMDKSVRKTFYGSNSALSPEQLVYAATDAMVLFQIYRQQLEALHKEQLQGVADLEFKCVGAVGDLELNGCKLDVDKWRQILSKVEEQRNQVRTELMEMLPSGSARQSSMFGGDEYLINLNSGQQIIAEFAKLGIVITDTSEATLTKLNHPAAKKLMEYKGHEKTLSAFGEGLLAMINKKTGRIHPDFIQYGADTGRFSCSNPNVQQIPATSDFRACFIPSEGYKLVTSDYSQAELRILAELSQDEGFLSAFKSGGDLHILAAAQMFNIKPEEVTKTQRSQAKAINFGLAYGMGPQGLAVRIDKTVEEARDLINAYFKAFSGVQRWLDKMGHDSVRLGYSPTPLGRKRYYQKPDQNDPDYRRKVSEIERRGKNAPIQGCNADMTKMALVFLKESLKNYDARVVNTVHDEVVVEVREDQAEEVCHLVEAEMIRAGREILKEVPIVADAKVGDYWSK
ncbi:MAG TPA: DNA polymerase, partial [Chloroflexia bacterium]|nr:DNA polymerase [Chloroflexia bacterium]